MILLWRAFMTPSPAELGKGKNVEAGLRGAPLRYFDQREKLGLSYRPGFEKAWSDVTAGPNSVLSFTETLTKTGYSGHRREMFYVLARHLVRIPQEGIRFERSQDRFSDAFGHFGSVDSQQARDYIAVLTDLRKDIPTSKTNTQVYGDEIPSVTAFNRVIRYLIPHVPSQEATELVSLFRIDDNAVVLMLNEPYYYEWTFLYTDAHGMGRHELCSQILSMATERLSGTSHQTKKTDTDWEFAEKMVAYVKNCWIFKDEDSQRVVLRALDSFYGKDHRWFVTSSIFNVIKWADLLDGKDARMRFIDNHVFHGLRVQYAQEIPQFQQLADSVSDRRTREKILDLIRSFQEGETLRITEEQERSRRRKTLEELS
jgi:hypothetical protein